MDEDEDEDEEFDKDEDGVKDGKESRESITDSRSDKETRRLFDRSMREDRPPERFTWVRISNFNFS